ncbi:hypothetical protein YC2023_059156 [Brassica napus]
MEHIESNEEFIIVRDSANRNLDEDKLKGRISSMFCQSITGKCVTQAAMETFHNLITEEELVKIIIGIKYLGFLGLRLDRCYLINNLSVTDVGKVLQQQKRIKRDFEGIILEEASLIDQEEMPTIGTCLIVLVKNKNHSSDFDEYASTVEGPYDVPTVVDVVDEYFSAKEGLHDVDVQMDLYGVPAVEGPYNVSVIESIVDEYLSAEEGPYDADI